MGFLRAVQRKLDLLTTRALRENLATPDDLAMTLPVTTVDRLEFFSRIGLISSELEDPLTDAYLWFLREYHRIQEIYKNTKRAVELPFNRHDFEHNSAVVSEFMTQ